MDCSSEFVRHLPTQVVHGGNLRFASEWLGGSEDPQDEQRGILALWVKHKGSKGDENRFSGTSQHPAAFRASSSKRSWGKKETRLLLPRGAWVDRSSWMPLNHPRLERIRPVDLLPFGSCVLFSLRRMSSRALWNLAKNGLRLVTTQSWLDSLKVTAINFYNPLLQWILGAF